MQTLLIYLGLFGIVFAVGVPIILALAVAAIFMLMISNIDLMVFASKFMVSMDNFSLTAMFFFILAGEIMNGGGMTRRIVAVVSKLVKNIPGGLAIIAVISCGLFAAVNGSAIATMIAIGALLYPAMVDQGYPPAFAAAVVAAGGVVGPIIPPSIPMIVYGSTTGDSIAALFCGGIVLGVFICAGECLVVYLISKKHGYGVNGKPVDFGSSKGVVWALIFPVIIFVSIVGGMMTATETSAFAAFYAWLIGTFVYKEFKITELPRMMLKSMKSSGQVMAIVGAATAVAWVLAFNRVPQEVTEAMVSTLSSQLLFIVVAFFILFIIGMIMDLTPAILILTPIFMGPVAAFGIDPVFFGVFFCAVLTAGLVTPPVGTLIYLGCSQSNKSFGEMVKALMPFIVIIYLILLVVAFFPQLITILPKTVFHLY